MEICRICGKKCKNKKGFSYHLTMNHNINFIEYLERYDDSFSSPICITCGKDIKYEDVQYRVRDKRLVSYQEYMNTRFCSDKCVVITDDTRKKLSEAGRKGGIAARGRKASKKTRDKISEKLKRYWNDFEGSDVRNRNFSGVIRKINNSIDDPFDKVIFNVEEIKSTYFELEVKYKDKDELFFELYKICIKKFDFRKKNIV